MLVPIRGVSSEKCEAQMSTEKTDVKEHLPAFKTIEECLEYCKEKQDGFYLTAFMIEAWIGQIICIIVEEYASMKSGNRHLQTGVGWDAWEFTFGHAKPKELFHILELFLNNTRIFLFHHKFLSLIFYSL